MSEIQSLRERIKEALRQTEYAEWAEAAAESVVPAICLLTEEAEDDSLPLGSSKIGGAPDLARPWPMKDGQPLSFLAQFNLPELAAFDEDGLLPEAGLLSFFIGVNALRGEWDSKNFAVIHEVRMLELQRAVLPDSDFPDSDMIVPAQSVEFKLNYHQSFNLRAEGQAYSKLVEVVENQIFQRDPHASEHTEDFLLGSGVYTDLTLDPGPDERTLWSIRSTGAEWPFFDGNAIFAFSFSLSLDDLRRGDFGHVQLGYAAS